MRVGCFVVTVVVVGLFSLCWLFWDFFFFVAVFVCFVFCFCCLGGCVGWGFFHCSSYVEDEYTILLEYLTYVKIISMCVLHDTV